jgi:UPF0755 protein
MNKVIPLFINISSLILCLFVFMLYNSFFLIHNNSVVKIRGGRSLSAIITELEKDGVLNFFNKKFFLHSTHGNIRAGHYRIFKGETIFSFAKRVESGSSEMCIITFVPGRTIRNYIDQINSSDDFYGDVVRKPHEGSVLPESYKHKCQTSRQAVFDYAQRLMSRELDKILTGYDFNNSHLKSRFDVLVMASIIEKETSLIDEMPKISSVFKNRMNIGMKLQTDPTVIYQITNETGNLERKLTLDDLRSGGAWNTYVIDGLPLTPIANPSIDAINAAINPSKTDYIFFVASGNGGHVFAKTYKEHLVNVKSYRYTLENS